MSFFKEFKEDFSQAMNELVPGEETPKKEEELVVNTLEKEVDAKAELDKLGGLFEKVEEPAAGNPKEAPRAAHAPVREPARASQPEPEKAVRMEPIPQAEARREAASQGKEGNRAVTVPEVKTEPATEEIKEDIVMSEEVTNAAAEEIVEMPQVSTLSDEVSDEITVITAGTSLTGNMESTGSIEVRGQVNGNIQCNGKLTVTGVIKGNSVSAEFFADAAKIEGEINTDGTVKIGLGSVVIGNISASSAVIAGAIKGDIDVQGPVVVDTSAVVMGNIKSRSVQINNGAVIEGFCSQCYAEVDVARLFD